MNTTRRATFFGTSIFRMHTEASVLATAAEMVGEHELAEEMRLAVDILKRGERIANGLPAEDDTEPLTAVQS